VAYALTALWWVRAGPDRQVQVRQPESGERDERWSDRSAKLVFPIILSLAFVRYMLACLREGWLAATFQKSDDGLCRVSVMEWPSPSHGASPKGILPRRRASISTGASKVHFGSGRSLQEGPIWRERWGLRMGARAMESLGGTRHASYRCVIVIAISLGEIVPKTDWPAGTRLGEDDDRKMSKRGRSQSGSRIRR
jgi:hypothetical protein